MKIKLSVTKQVAAMVSARSGILDQIGVKLRRPSTESIENRMTQKSNFGAVVKLRFFAHKLRLRIMIMYARAALQRAKALEYLCKFERSSLVRHRLSEIYVFVFTALVAFLRNIHKT